MRVALVSLCVMPWVLAGCAGHHAHHPSMMSGGAGYGAPMATAPTLMGPSMETLGTGYKKMMAAAGTQLYFIDLKNGDTVSSPLTVRFGLRGMGVAPAGMAKDGTGHHHLLVDVDTVDVNAPLPADDRHRHFGAGQTEVSLPLTPGPHTLQLVLGDPNHIPHHPPVMSERITVMVK